MKVVGYVSSGKSVEIDRLAELNVHKEKIMELCQNHGFDLAKIYEEPKDSREDYKPALIKMLNEASHRRFTKVFVFDLQIFGQDLSFTSWVMSELKKYNIEVHPVSSFLSLKEQMRRTPLEIMKRRIKNKVRDIGSLPEVVTRVTELVQDPKSSAAQLSRVIAHDPGLTSKVLKLVNSAYYGFPKQISSIQHAVMILGFTTMRGLVLSSSIYKIFTPKNTSIIALDYKKLWKHLLITAIISKKVNKYLFNQDNDDIFSSAILHDIGKIILDQYDHENYIQVLHQLRRNLTITDQVPIEEKFCGVNHQEIGYIVSEEWNLPESLADVVRYHHDPLQSQENTQLVSIVYIGDILAHIALDKITFNINMFNSEVLDYLGLLEDGLLSILEEILGEIDSYSDMESFFN